MITQGNVFIYISYDLGYKQSNLYINTDFLDIDKPCPKLVLHQEVKYFNECEP